MLHQQNIPHRRLLDIACLATILAGPAPALAHASGSVYLEELTAPELQARIAAGTTTILVPIGGTEQSGPHLALGKHNVRARVLAGKIAQRLGNAVVAPVVAYVPEGSIAPPAGHMRFAGTISIPQATFESILDASARSFCQHGLRDVFFLGDHGGYQESEEKVAARLNRQRGFGPGCRAHALLEYYQATQSGYVAELERRGYGAAEIGVHAGLADTSLALAVDPALVRTDLLAAGAKAGPAGGVRGDPSRATAALGQIGVERVLDASVSAIRAALRARPDHNLTKPE